MGRSYYLLLVAFLTSSLGNWIYRLALPLLVLELTGSALQTALIYVLEYAPFLLFSLPGGVFADRFDRRRLLIAGDLLATVIVAGLAALVWADVPFVWPIYVAAFLLASVEPLYHPAFQSFLPSLVEDESLEKANAWMQGGENLLTLTGPVAGGALVAFLDFQTALLIDAITFAVSAVAIAAIPAAKATAKLGEAADASRLRFGRRSARGSPTSPVATGSCWRARSCSRPPTSGSGWSRRTSSTIWPSTCASTRPPSASSSRARAPVRSSAPWPPCRCASASPRAA